MIQPFFKAHMNNPCQKDICKIQPFMMAHMDNPDYGYIKNFISVKKKDQL